VPLNIISNEELNKVIKSERHLNENQKACRHSSYLLNVQTFINLEKNNKWTGTFYMYAHLHTRI